MNNTRAFLHITYKLYGHLDKLSGTKKSNCINCYLSLMKHAWKKNNYECGLRYSTIAKETKLSRITVRRTLDTLEKLHIISTVRGRSGKSYKINQLFLKTESDSSIIYNNKNKKYKIDHSNVYKRSVLVEDINTLDIENIIRDNRNDKDSLILNLSKLPLKILNSDINNPYYIKLAKEKKAELERESKATYVHPQKIINELTKIKKNSNPRYREKVAFNKRNNLDLER
jgi:predicted transcriptional regulator